MNADEISSNPINAKGKTMKSRFQRQLLLLASLAAPLALLPQETAQAQSVVRPSNEVVLSIGRSQLVTVPGTMTDLFVANPGVADVKIKSARQLYIFGKGPGETTVYVNNASGQIIWSANIRVGENIDSVDQMLRMAMPDAKISVTTIGQSTYLLTGTVASPEDAGEAQRLVEAFVGSDSKKVISRLRMATPLQVNLQVRFAEVSHSLVHEINSNITSRDTSGGMLFGIGRGNPGTIANATYPNLPRLDASSQFKLPDGTPLPPGSISLPYNPQTQQFMIGGASYTFNKNAAGQTAVALAGHLAGMDLLQSFDLGERLGLVRTLQQPNLTALSGETAKFLAGGQFPIVTTDAQGQVSVAFKDYGVKLQYTPTVLANGRISLRVSPEVSQLSTQGAVIINGFSMPALTTRSAETTVELGSGQSFMIAGLMSTNAQNSIEKTPAIGDMPVLGALFRSTSYKRDETELVIVVTPYLVNPVDAADIKLPTDGIEEPNEIQRIFGNMGNAGKSGASRPLPSAAMGAGTKPDVSLTAPPPVADDRMSRKQQAAASEAPAPGFNLK